MPKYLDYEGRKKLRAWIRSHFLGKGERAADAALLGGKPPEYYAGPVNLLGNGNFLPMYLVNQRGQTSYSGSVYNIDRWRAYHAETTVNVTDDGISVSGNRLYQIVPQNIIDATKTYTLAAMKSDGTLDICCAKFSSGADASYGTALYTSNSTYLVRLDRGYTWIWAALYEGVYTADTLPPYVPRPYSVELAECRRWYLPMDASQWYEAKRLHGDNPRIEVPGSFTRAPTLIGTPKMYLDDGVWHDMTPGGISLLPDRCVFRLGGYDSLTTHGQSYIVTGLSGVSCEL
ncbi:hypothetical protein [Beduinella massiliensis]|uniref:hypothetical protein n=1 Tax=Beduinella massiliensis TaxID=1852363 RepID=UPI000C82325F